MKKLFFVLAVAGFMAACNNNSESAAPAESVDSSATTQPAAPAADSTMHMDSTAAHSDSTAK